MMMRAPSPTIILLSLFSIATCDTTIENSKILNDLNSNFQIDHTVAKQLLKSAVVPLPNNNAQEQQEQQQRRNLQYYDDGEEEDEEYDATQHISSYSIQFQGCHHIQQWNNQDYYDDDIRIKTKRLVRFRLVPYDQCRTLPPWSSVFETAQQSVGKYKDYGEYIVDLNTFVDAYVQAKVEENEALCGNCQDGCYYAGGDDDASSSQYSSCMSACYQENGCDENVEQVLDYTECAAYDNYVGDDYAGDDADEREYYFGPYCAHQGGEIRMNLFSDETCSTLVKCNGGRTQGHNCYRQKYGKELPFTKKSIVQDACYACSSNYRDLESYEDGDINYENYDFGYARDVCENVYTPSGKCEAYMSKGTGVDNACSYISSLRIGVTNDGYAVGIKRSLAADAAMSVLAIGTVVIGMYIYYLKHLLGK